MSTFKNQIRVKREFNHPASRLTQVSVCQSQSKLSQNHLTHVLLLLLQTGVLGGNK